MKTLATLLFAVMLGALSACANGPTKPSHSDQMNVFIGKATKLDISQKYGPPDKQADLGGGLELWEYRLNENKYTSPTGYRFSTYDRFRIYFRNNVLHSWAKEGVTD